MSKSPKSFLILFVIAMNLAPIYGVLNWDWHSFDIIFLYWLENIVIGLFVVLRMLIRRYSNFVEIGSIVFMAGFFTLHYGGFTFGHGVFVFSLFAKSLPGSLQGAEFPQDIIMLIEARHMALPILALLLLQALDWGQEIAEKGIGSKAPPQLMMSPYRRIMILHITIIASGFALSALNEPIAGLLVLVAIKTGFDVYQWRKGHAPGKHDVDKPLVLNDAIRKEIDDMIDNPRLQVNGEEIRFDSFEELRASSHYKLMESMVSVASGRAQLDAMDEYVAERIRERESTGLKN